MPLVGRRRGCGCAPWNRQYDSPGLGISGALRSLFRVIGEIWLGERGAGFMKSAERRADAASFHAVSGANSTQAFDWGLAHHRAGRLAEAETSYREVLAAEPNHLRALHLFGLLYHQVGRLDMAAELLHRAITRDGANARLFSDLGVV
jgi:tetratricopeptide (TPR) repeat protein